MKPIILPEEKLDELANKVCARILQGHYFTNGVIRGEELKDFADHQQVNKFLLFQIYQTWNLQPGTSKFRKRSLNPCSSGRFITT